MIRQYEITMIEPELHEKLSEFENDTWLEKIQIGYFWITVDQKDLKLQKHKDDIVIRILKNFFVIFSYHDYYFII